jgi:DNA-binding transcriptional regulator YhcF (GntR family)
MSTASGATWKGRFRPRTTRRRTPVAGCAPSEGSLDNPSVVQVPEGEARIREHRRVAWSCAVAPARSACAPCKDDPAWGKQVPHPTGQSRVPKTVLDHVADALDRQLPVSLSVQLKGLIEYGISCGDLTAGTRLPSVRQLAEAGGIAPMTAVAVYRDLRAAGLIEARPGAGTFVAAGAQAGTSAGLARVREHLDAALAAGEAVGLARWQVASILNARIGLERARDSRPVRLLMLGVFPEATRSYAREIARQLRPGDTVAAATFDGCRAGSCPDADLVVTLAHRQGEAERLLAGQVPVTSVSLLPSERTRSLLARIAPTARVGIVAVFPEFLALMKSGVRRFAPRVREIAGLVLPGTAHDETGLIAFAERIDVLVYASGAERALEAVGPAIGQIEYRHVPDARAVRDHLLPLVEAIRVGRPHRDDPGGPRRSSTESSRAPVPAQPIAVGRGRRRTA